MCEFWVVVGNGPWILSREILKLTLYFLILSWKWFRMTSVWHIVLPAYSKLYWLSIRPGLRSVIPEKSYSNLGFPKQPLVEELIRKNENELLSVIHRSQKMKGWVKQCRFKNILNFRNSSLMMVLQSASC